MIWTDRQRTEAHLRKLTHEDESEENVYIEDVQDNILVNGTPVNGVNFNTIEKNIGSYGADTYSNTSTYSVGDVVTYEGLFYRCNTAISTEEEFNSSHWTNVSLEELIEIEKSELETKISSKIGKTTIVTTANTNLNDYVEDGVYYFSPSYTPVNIPTGVINGWLQVMKSTTNGAVKQIWYRGGTANTNDFETYVRTKTSGTWSNWQRYMVENDLYYKDGDSLTLTWAGSGHLTSSATEFVFSIPLPKRVKNIVNANITAGQLFVRRPTGGYIVNGDSILTDNNIIINAYENILTVRLVHSTAYSETNNIPVGIQISNLKIEFTEPFTPEPILN